MGMTEYEVADVAGSVLANFLTSLTVFLSIVSAYVISAFVAGQRLTYSGISSYHSFDASSVSCNR